MTHYPPTIFLLPIEPFEERYTEQWYRWWRDGLEQNGFRVVVIGGGSLDPKQWGRTGGEFLDPCRTWQWKGEQVRQLASMWDDGHSIKDGDVVLSLDGWGPATTAAAYMRDTTGRDIKVVTFWHAGAYDPHDFLARTRCRTWSPAVEAGWHLAADLILVGSEFHAGLIRENAIAQGHLLTWSKIRATGYPILRPELVEIAEPAEWHDRPRLVVFPHRIAPEKGPDEWDRIIQEYFVIHPDDDARFERARDVCDQHDKRTYYSLLAQARVVVSCAWQETFGIAMQEGIALGAWPVWPDRCSYPEVMPQAISVCGAGTGRYRSRAQAVAEIRNALDSLSSPVWSRYHEHAIDRAADAIRSILPRQRTESEVLRDLPF